MAHEKYALEDMPDMRKLGFRGIQYYDVMTDRAPEACYDPRHPLSRKESGEWRGRTLALAREYIGGSGSEGGIDFCIGDFDYVLYVRNQLHNELPEIADEEFPFWFIAYHGIMLYNPACCTVNAMIKKDRTLELESFEAGGRPLVYFHSRFMANVNDWMGDEDFRYDSPEQLKTAVSIIKKNYDKYRSMKDLQYEFLCSYASIAPGIVRTVYENGTEIVYNKTSQEWNGIPPYSYRISSGNKKI